LPIRAVRGWGDGLIAPQKPPRKTGVAHLFAAARYSAGGARRLWREAAFRHEVLALGIAAGLFLAVGATLPEFLGLAVLALLVMAVEALNTAIEELVDHESPEWSEFARNAKDLGSFAVMCLLVAAALYVGWVTLF
jgi:diacylglycerol kinase (ATP)